MRVCVWWLQDANIMDDSVTFCAVAKAYKEVLDHPGQHCELPLLQRHHTMFLHSLRRYLSDPTSLCWRRSLRLLPGSQICSRHWKRLMLRYMLAPDDWMAVEMRYSQWQQVHHFPTLAFDKKSLVPRSASKCHQSHGEDGG